MIEIKETQKQKREIVRCTGREIMLSDGTVLKSDSGEFDVAIVKAILEAGE